MTQNERIVRTSAGTVPKCARKSKRGGGERGGGEGRGRGTERGRKGNGQRESNQSKRIEAENRGGEREKMRRVEMR